MGQNTPETVSLSIALRYVDIGEFKARYHPHLSSAGLFLRTKTPKVTGTRIQFQLTLADKTTAISGSGVVVATRGGDQPGMAIRFHHLDTASQALINETVREFGDGHLAPTPFDAPYVTFGREATKDVELVAIPQSGTVPTLQPEATEAVAPANQGESHGMPRRRSSVSVPWVRPTTSPPVRSEADLHRFEATQPADVVVSEALPQVSAQSANRGGLTDYEPLPRPREAAPTPAVNEEGHADQTDDVTHEGTVPPEALAAARSSETERYPSGEHEDAEEQGTAKQTGLDTEDLKLDSTPIEPLPAFLVSAAPPRFEARQVVEENHPESEPPTQDPSVDTYDLDDDDVQDSNVSVPEDLEDIEQSPRRIPSSSGARRAIVERGGGHGSKDREPTQPEIDPQVVSATNSSASKSIIVGVDIGHRWLRVSARFGADLKVLPLSDLGYVPALVGSDPGGGALVTGLRALELEQRFPERVLAPMELLQAHPWTKPPWDKIVRKENGQTKVRLGDIERPIEEILATLFQTIQSACEVHLNHDRFTTVIAIPDTKGPEVIQILDLAIRNTRLTPAYVSNLIAALAAYDLGRRSAAKVLVIDWNSDRLKLSLSECLPASEPKLLVSEEHPELGARAVDLLLAERISELQEELSSSPSERPNRPSILLAVERSRMRFTGANALAIHPLEATAEPLAELSYQVVESLSQDNMAEILRAIQKFLKAHDGQKKLDAAVVVGNAGGFQPLLSALREVFGPALKASIPPADALAIGAARQFERGEVEASGDLRLLECTVGMEFPPGRFRPLIECGTPIPLSIHRNVPIEKAAQRIDLRVLLGETTISRDSAHMGTLSLTGLGGGQNLDLKMDVAMDGRIVASLTDPHTGKNVSQTFTTDPDSAKHSSRDIEDPNQGEQKGFFRRLWSR
jgi:uncharacterized protein (TIGR02266 family)